MRIHPLMTAALALATACLCPAMADDIELSTGDGARARFHGGRIVSLTDSAGRQFVVAPPEGPAEVIRHLQAEAAPNAMEVVSTGARHAVEECSGFEGLPEGLARNRYEAKNDAFQVTQEASCGKGGLWGVALELAHVPRDMHIIVTARSGLRLDATSPGADHTLDYPMAWEAQFLLIEDARGNGVCLSARDFDPHLFKRLRLRREAAGWRIELIAMPFAPFEERSAWGPVTWHIRPYEGGFRAGVSRYREALLESADPTQLAAQQPPWVEDIRSCAIVGLNPADLESLARRLDPAQTLLYVPDWRAAGYDRDYPTYDEPRPGLAPFMARAHDLGFRVMLHVNYFGCHPEHPAYAEMEPYHLRSAWGGHEKQWWDWERATPPIKFAYINPAYKGWRDLFTAAMVELCSDYDVDALHIDQTLVIQNDYNGLIDGMSMIEGNIAIHEDLRKALPHVALSGEGLNEVTFRGEAFAQRHVHGINHTERSFDRATVAMAHPVCSYLFRPYTAIYGYLGTGSPAEGQYYAAWQDAYRHWGVVPTLARWGIDLDAPPEGFVRQFFDEARFWQEARLVENADGPWGPDTAFPFRTADGATARWTRDRRLMRGDTEVCRTVTGVRELEAPGTIPGWRAYDADRLLGLDEKVYYPYFTDPRTLDTFHVSALPEGFTLAGVSARDRLVTVSTRATSAAEVHLVDRLPTATTGTRPFDGVPTSGTGELNDPNGGTFARGEGGFRAHPVWKGDGLGEVYARFELNLDSTPRRFVSGVALNPLAVIEDRSDGVTFRVSARSGDLKRSAEVHHAGDEPVTLELDLAPFRDRQTSLELGVHPGPDRNPSYDWARWDTPRVVPAGAVEGTVTAVTPNGGWALALTPLGAVQLDPAATQHTIEGVHPGTFFLLRERPAAAALPVNLAHANFVKSFTGPEGVPLDSAPYAAAAPGAATCGGVMLSGLYAHPPNLGQTRVHVPLTLPDRAVRFVTEAGLRDGNESEGVVFRVLVNGGVEAELSLDQETTGWQELAVDLSPWRGRSIVLSLVTDSEGSNSFDWAYWAEPRIMASGTP